MKIFNFLLIIGLTTFWSETKSNFINEVRNKYGNSDKSYSIKMKSVTKDSENNKSTEKKTKNITQKNKPIFSQKLSSVYNLFPIFHKKSSPKETMLLSST